MPISNSQLAQQISEMVSYWRTRDIQFAEWLGGAADGGPFGDGRYPLTDYLGVTQYLYCPAALEAGVTNSASAAAAQAALAGASKDAALAAQAAAEAARNLALTYRNEAQAARDLALSYRDQAANSQAIALTHRNNAAASAAAAAGSATDADISADAAASSAGDAASSASAAAASAAAAAASAAAAATFDPELFAKLSDNETITGSWTLKGGVLISVESDAAPFVISRAVVSEQRFLYEMNGSGNWLRSESSASNSKNFYIRATTDEAGTAGSSEPKIVLQGRAGTNLLILGEDGVSSNASLWTINSRLLVHNGTLSPGFRVRSTNGSPWAIELYRDDLGSGSKVYYNGTGWFWEHKGQFPSIRVQDVQSTVPPIWASIGTSSGLNTSCAIGASVAGTARFALRDTSNGSEFYAGAYSTAVWVGSVGGHPLEFWTNGTVRGSVSNNGWIFKERLSIGTVSPSNVPLRVESPSFPDAGLEVQRGSSTEMLLLSYNRTAAAWCDLILYGRNGDAIVIDKDDGNIMLVRPISTSVMFQDANTSLSKGGSNSLRITTASGYLEIGPRNTGFCHFSTDRSTYYFERPVNFDSEIRQHNAGVYLWYDNSSFTTGKIVVSTSAPSGSHPDGTIWIQREA